MHRAVVPGKAGENQIGEGGAAQRRIRGTAVGPRGRVGVTPMRFAALAAGTLALFTVGCAAGQAPDMDGIPGYRAGDTSLPRSPITMKAFGELKASLLFTDDDVEALRMSRDVLEPHVSELVGVWYGFVGSNPHLLASFSNAQGEVDSGYLERVRARFERWVLDTARAEYDQGWLDWQMEIGRRHHRVGKNKTDHADAVDHIAFRHVPALTIPITTTIRPFLERGGHSAEDVDRMHAAWVKSVLMQSILWSYPYVREGDF